MAHKIKISGPSQTLGTLAEHFEFCPMTALDCKQCALHRIAQVARELNRRSEDAKTIGVQERELQIVLMEVLAEDCA